MCRPLQNGDFPLTKRPNTHLNDLRASEANFREHILRRHRVTAPLRALKAVPNLHLSGLLPKVLRAKMKAHLRNPKFRLMNPSLLSRLKRPLKGLSKSARKSLLPDSPVPSHADLRPKKVDSFVKKYLKRNGTAFNPVMDRRQMNIAGRILDPLGPLAQLWQSVLIASKEKSGLDPAEVIELVQRAIALTGNASFCALVDRRKGLLAKVSSDSLDLIEDPSLFCPGSTDLFGTKFKKSFLKELKLSKELDSLVSRPRHYGNPNKQKPFRFQPGKGPGFNSRYMEPEVPKPWGSFLLPSGKKQLSAIPASGKQNLKGIPTVRSLMHVPVGQKDQKLGDNVHSLPSSRLKIDFQDILRPPNLAGRLLHFLPNWRQITSDPDILMTVAGYKLPFTLPPHQTSAKAPLTISQRESEKVDSEVALLREKGVLHVACSVPDQFVSSLFLVPKRDGNSRPVINLKDLNVFLQYDHFKMEGIHLLRDLLQPNDWLGKIDLKDAYFVIPIWRDHRKYLRFVWKQTLLEFACLPFGLAVAPRVFTKIMKPVVSLLRRTGIRLIIYLDDILLMNASETGLRQDMHTAQYLLENLGFVIDLEKSCFQPTQQ